MVADSNDIEALLEDDIKLVAQKLVNMVAAANHTATDHRSSSRDETDVPMCDDRTAAVPSDASSSYAISSTSSSSTATILKHTSSSSLSPPQPPDTAILTSTTINNVKNNNNNSNHDHHGHTNGVIGDESSSPSSTPNNSVNNVGKTNGCDAGDDTHLSNDNNGDTAAADTTTINSNGGNHEGEPSPEEPSAMEVSEDDGPWKDIQIDPTGETPLPNGLVAICGVVQPPFYREQDSDRPFRFTNQLSFLKSILTKYICRYKAAKPFIVPVDSVKFKIPHYYLVIRQPMDLGTVKNRINFLWYDNAAECIADLRLIFSNCYRFNPPQDSVYKAGKKLEEYLDDKLKEMPAEEEEIPCPPRPSYDEYQKLIKQSPETPRTGSISEHSENGDFWPYGPIKMTTRSERGVMVRKPSKDLPEPITTPQPRPPTVKKVPLNQPMRTCLEFVKDLFGKKHAEYAWPFWQPVNPVEYPDYAQKIKRPMDLSTIKTKLESGQYITLNDYANDMRLMFSNCLRYNTPESAIIEQARKLREQFEYQFSRLPDEWHSQRLEVPKHNHTSNHNHSRTSTPPVTPVSLRISTGGSGGASASASFTKHHSFDNGSSHKRHKSSSGGTSGTINIISTHHRNNHSDSESKKSSSKAKSSSASTGNLGIDLTAFPAREARPSFPGTARIEQLEKHVATLTNALQTVLSSTSSNGNALGLNLSGFGIQQPHTPTSAPPILLNGGSAPPASRGRPRKNGMPAQPRNLNNNNNSARKAPKKQAQKRKVRHLSSSSEEEDDDRPDAGSNSAQPQFDPEDIEDLKMLKNDLENLRANDLQNVLRILQRTEPSLRCDDESNVEIDFEALQSSTLVALRKYVTSCMLNASGSSSLV